MNKLYLLLSTLTISINLYPMKDIDQDNPNVLLFAGIKLGKPGTIKTALEHKASLDTCLKNGNNAVTYATWLCCQTSRRYDSVIKTMKERAPSILQGYLPRLTAAMIIGLNIVHKSHNVGHLTVPTRESIVVGMLSWAFLKLPGIRYLTQGAACLLVFPIRWFISKVFQSEATETQSILSYILKQPNLPHLMQENEKKESALSLIDSAKNSIENPGNKKALEAFHSQMLKIVSTQPEQSLQIQGYPSSALYPSPGTQGPIGMPSGDTILPGQPTQPSAPPASPLQYPEYSDSGYPQHPGQQ